MKSGRASIATALKSRSVTRSRCCCLRICTYQIQDTRSNKVLCRQNRPALMHRGKNLECLQHRVADAHADSTVRMQSAYSTESLMHMRIRRCACRVEDRPADSRNPDRTHKLSTLQSNESESSGRSLSMRSSNGRCQRSRLARSISE